MRTDVARMYLLGFYRQAGPPAVLAAQIRDRDSDQVVYEAAWQQTSATARTLATSTNSALVPGRNYRLWVAFNKPMRIRDDAGNVVAYRGQTSGPSVGTVTLEFPDLTGQNLALPVASGDSWLAAIASISSNSRRRPIFGPCWCSTPVARWNGPALRPPG